MSIEVHIDWQGATHLVGRLRAAERSPAVTFAYASAFDHPLMDHARNLS